MDCENLCARSTRLSRHMHKHIRHTYVCSIDVSELGKVEYAIETFSSVMARYSYSCE